MKKESEKIKEKRKICLFEIMLIVVSSIAFAWIIGGYNPDALPQINIKFSAVSAFAENFDLIPGVYAQSTGTSCCLNSKSGLSCSDIPTSECSDKCDGNCVATSCSQVAECKAGCCFDKDEGLCAPNSLKQQCESNTNGKWTGDESCNINECKLGCCVFGLNVQYVTEQRCKKLSIFEGTIMNFDTSKSESTCIGALGGEQTGACVLKSQTENEKNNCKFTTKADCQSMSGEFHNNYLCSNIELNTICEKEKTVGCLDGKDEIYWIDSCGNRENIYSSDKSKSWNDGKVLSKEQSCNSNSNNAGSSTCGNCNYQLGSVCKQYRAGIDTKIKDGEFTCRDLNCKKAIGNAGEKKDRLNGESWCVYDGKIGPMIGGFLSGGRGNLGINDALSGISRQAQDSNVSQDSFKPESGANDFISQMTGGASLSGIQNILSGFGGFGFGPSADVVGSRHFRYYCQDGEVKVEPCADYRKEICVENTKKISNGKTISDAMCRTNMWEQCIGANGQKGCEGQCLIQCAQNPDCSLLPVFVSSGFKFISCVPKYPPGFDLSSTSSNGISGIAQNVLGSQLENFGGGQLGQISQLTGGVSNSGGSEAAQVCNLASQTCTSVWVKMCPGGWKCVKNCQCHEATFTLQMTNLCISLGDCGPKTNIAGNLGFLGAYISKKGKHGKTPIQPGFLGFLYVINAIPSKGQKASGGIYSNVSAITQLPLAGIQSLFGGAGSFARMSPGKVGRNMFGRASSGFNPAFTAGATFLGAFAGGQVGILASGGFLGMGGFMFANIIGAVIVIGIMLAMGCGKIETVKIEYKCQPWVRPMGSGGGISGILNLFSRDNQNLLGKLSGGGCDFCNKDPLKPCSKYRCESLGMRCKLINENTGFDKCVSDDTASGIPVISPFEEALNNTMFKYTDITTNGFKVKDINGECLEAFTPLTFGVKTDIYANCKWAESDESNPSSLENDFLEGGIFTTNHSLMASLPSAESLIASETNSSGEFSDAVSNQTLYNLVLNKAGNMNIHVKCSNIDGKSNEQDYVINLCVKPGPDKTPPIIIATSPPENSNIKFDATSQNAVMYVNEPAECRWDLIKPALTKQKENYNSLKNSMNCVTNAAEGSAFGYRCSAELPTDASENKFYVMCRDQPWLGENDSRNIGNIYEYVIKKGSELKINSIMPNGEITKGNEPIEIEINAETSGGSDSGNARCQYSLDNINFAEFFETGTLNHAQKLTQMMRGNYTAYVKCTDSAGDSAQGQSQFSLLLDTNAPEVTRVYYSSGNLKILTNKEADCVYSNENIGCSFNFENGTEMQAGFSEEHTTPWNENAVYYIKCQDIWGNKKSDCSITVQPKQIAGV